MKKFVFIAVILLCIPFLSSAQEDNIPKIYKAWITLNNNSPEVKGVLYDIKDSSISLTNSFSFSGADYLSGNFKLTTINYNNIYRIKTRRNNSVVAGVLLGTSAGVITGAIIGGSQGDDPPCASFICLFRMTAKDKALLGGVLGAFAGAGVGALSGLITIKIPINGNIQTFNKNKDRLRKYSYLR